MKLEIADLNQKRAEIALQRLLENEDVLEFYNIRITNPKKLNIKAYKNPEPEIIVISNWQDNSIDKELAKSELVEAKKNLEIICSEWKALNEFIQTISSSIYLHHDYGMGEVRSCELKKNGELLWLLENQ